MTDTGVTQVRGLKVRSNERHWGHGGQVKDTWVTQVKS